MRLLQSQDDRVALPRLGKELHPRLRRSRLEVAQRPSIPSGRGEREVSRGSTWTDRGITSMPHTSSLFTPTSVSTKSSPSHRNALVPPQPTPASRSLVKGTTPPSTGPGWAPRFAPAAHEEVGVGEGQQRSTGQPVGSMGPRSQS
eukprot:7268871-Pyramimonas_sp.AAC.1